MNLLFSADDVELGSGPKRCSVLHLFTPFLRWSKEKNDHSKAQTTFTMRFNCAGFSWSFESP